METIDLTPSWSAAVDIYIEVLLANDSRESEGVIAARADLKRLAGWADGQSEENAIDPNQLTLTFEE